MKIGSKINSGKKLRDTIKEKGIAVLPGVIDAHSARLVEMAGFDGVYITSFGLHASMLASNDIDLLTTTEMVDQSRRIAHAVNIPAMVDGESGGMNIEGTIREFRLYEEAGIGAIQFDDELKPCKCPFLRPDQKQQLVSIEEMCKKIEAAVATRKNKDTLIVARSDTYGSVYDDGTTSHLDEQIKRLNAYAKAGADVIFPIATKFEDYCRVANAVDAPYKVVCLSDMDCQVPDYELHKYSVEDWKNAGFNIYIVPLLSLQASGKAIEAALTKFKETGLQPIDMFMRQDYYNKILRMTEVDELGLNNF